MTGGLGSGSLDGRLALGLKQGGLGDLLHWVLLGLLIFREVGLVFQLGE